MPFIHLLKKGVKNKPFQNVGAYAIISLVEGVIIVQPRRVDG
jgi:hypothetical protein